MKNETIEIGKITYSATGHVLGHFWGGGIGAYGSKKITSDTKEELLDKAKKMLDDGSLDSGMGYESLIGACIEITCKTVVEIDGKDFVNKEYEVEFIGNLTEEQIDFLTDLDLI